MKQESTWKNTIQTFRKNLEKQEGLFSVKDLCDFLLKIEWENKEETVSYLEDYLRVSDFHFSFHSKWLQLPNFKNVADYDAREIATVKELLALLRS